MRNSLMELLMYEPQTDLVHAQPIVVQPAMITTSTTIHGFWRPGRSFIEYAVQHGFTVVLYQLSQPRPRRCVEMELGRLSAARAEWRRSSR